MELRSVMKIPEAWRLLRISLRPRRMLGIAMISVSVCALIVAYVSVMLFVVDSRRTAVIHLFDTEYFKVLFPCIFGYVALLWAVGIPILVSSSLADEFVGGTWVFQQTTPQPVRMLLAGKILGAGGDVYVASLAALPFLFVSAVFSSYSMISILGCCLFVVIFSFFFATVFLSVATSIEKQKAGIWFLAVILYISLFSTFSAFVEMAEYSVQGPILLI